MRKIILSMLTVLTIGTICLSGVTTSKAATWRETKSVTITEGAFTYEAYLSEDGKESWIHKVTVKPEAGDERILKFPETMEGAVVTKLGSKPEEDSDSEVNIVGTHIETYHGGSGVTRELKGVEEIAIPETVTELTGFTFSGFFNVKKIHLPEKLTELPSATFYGCSSLTDIDIPDNLEKLGYQVFGKCTSLKRLQLGSKIKDFSQAHLKKSSVKKLTIAKNNPYIMAKKGAVYSKDGTILYAALPAVKELHIGKKVKTISTEVKNLNEDPYFGYLGRGFLNLANKKVTISKKNKVFAKKGNCIYDKKNGKLLYYMASNKGMKIEEGVTEISDVKFGKNNQYSNKITLPQSLKKMDLAAISIEKGYLHKIVLKSKVKIANKNKISIWSKLEKVKIVVPKKLKKYYTKQFKEYKKHCKVVVK